MPNVKKVTSLHRRMKSGDNMRMLNFDPVTGQDFSQQSYWCPNSSDYMNDS